MLFQTLIEINLNGISTLPAYRQAGYLILRENENRI